jgi:hypothetical protein
MSRECRQRAGLTLSQASRHLRVTPKYLARCERTGQFPYVLARRAARLYHADLTVFLPGSASSQSY